MQRGLWSNVQRCVREISGNLKKHDLLTILTENLNEKLGPHRCSEFSWEAFDRLVPAIRGGGLYSTLLVALQQAMSSHLSQAKAGEHIETCIFVMAFSANDHVEYMSRSACIRDVQVC